MKYTVDYIVEYTVNYIVQYTVEYRVEYTVEYTNKHRGNIYMLEFRVMLWLKLRRVSQGLSLRYRSFKTFY